MRKKETEIYDPKVVESIIDRAFVCKLAMCGRSQSLYLLKIAARKMNELFLGDHNSRPFRNYFDSVLHF
ncbi:MAG TPA: hypothetical protein VMY43_04715 [Methanothrix sp.]|nr:hypothetical protein [Methanothrix sp.]